MRQLVGARFGFGGIIFNKDGACFDRNGVVLNFVITCFGKWKARLGERTIRAMSKGAVLMLILGCWMLDGRVLGERTIRTD